MRCVRRYLHGNHSHARPPSSVAPGSASAVIPRMWALAAERYRKLCRRGAGVGK
jgi:hypothetical protein